MTKEKLLERNVENINNNSKNRYGLYYANGNVTLVQKIDSGHSYVSEAMSKREMEMVLLALYRYIRKEQEAN